MVSVVAVGSLYVVDGRLSVGGLAACTLLAGRAVQPVLRALGLWTRFQSIQLAEEKLAELDRFAPDRSAEVAVQEPFRKLQFERVSFRFRDEGPYLLQDMSLAVSPGEIIGIRGKNGSGKSTLLRLMMGALEPSLGRILINGQDVSKSGGEKWQQDIAYLAQRPVLFDGSVLENITMFCDELTDEAMAIAQTLGLDKVFARYPEGFDTQIGARAVSNLPGGVGQRVVAARALLRRPKLILFDEANAAMDNIGDTLLRELLLRHQANAAIVLISYRPSLLAIATSRFDLEAGRLVPVTIGSATDRSQGQGTAS
jgi:ATP-binding cassette subfamily C protein LapB